MDLLMLAANLESIASVVKVGLLRSECAGFND